MNKIILLFLFIQGLSFSQYGWYRQHNAPVTKLTDVMFVNDNTGFACAFKYDPLSRGKFLKTTNGGNNWSVTDIDSLGGTSLVTPQRLWFVNANTGYIIGGHIVKTTNGGASFTRIRYNSGLLTDIKFVNDQTGFVAGYVDSSLSAILRTSNGGLSWQIIPISPNGVVTRIFFLNANTGWLSKAKINQEPNGIYKTTNGGLNWFIPSQSPDMGGIPFFYSENEGETFGWMGLGGGGTMTIHGKTSNSGANWFPSGGYDDTYVEDFYVLNSTTAWICGGSAAPSTSSGKILMTTNTGYNWTVQSYDNSPQKFTAISFVNGLSGWAIANTEIYKTSTGGVISVQQISTELPSEFSLSQNFPNPFNPTTKIRFEIPLSRGVSEGRGVSLIIYDLLGREVAVLVNEQLKPGTYEADWDASSYPSEVYFYKLSTADFTQTRKMVLVK